MGSNRLKDVETEEVQLEVYRCGCGFVIGLDATFIAECGLSRVLCPNCGAEILVHPDPENETLAVA